MKHPEIFRKDTRQSILASESTAFGRFLTCRGDDTAATRVGIRLFRRPQACTTAQRKARKKWRRRCERPATPAYFLALSFEERAKEDREAKMVGNPPRTSLNDHERLRLSHDRSGHSVCDGFFIRHFHIAGTGRPKACRKNMTANPANRLILALHRNPFLSQAEGLHERTAKSVEKETCSVER